MLAGGKCCLRSTFPKVLWVNGRVHIHGHIGLENTEFNKIKQINLDWNFAEPLS